MISVLTLTYQRKFLLEEAIESFLRQDFPGESEMVIINDNPNVEYVFEHPKIRIINVKERFPSLGQKLKFGFSHCKYEYIYRLDDDDLLAPWALRHTWDDITTHPGYEIYRSSGHYFFVNNQFRKMAGSVNNGNVYTKKYLSRIEIPEMGYGQDAKMTFSFKANTYVSRREQKSMIYRWGMSTYHLSGMGNISEDARHEWTDRIVERVAMQRNTDVEEGILTLHPHFDNEYYEQLP